MKTCFITGGNSGIGKEACTQIASKGYQVFVGARNKKRGEKAVKEIKDKSGSSHVKLILIDLSSKASILQASELLHQEIDQLDVLIHNAADFDITRKKAAYSVDNIETIWATNHIGPVQLTNSLLDLIQKSEQGRILTVSSKGLLVHPKLIVDLEDPEFNNRTFKVPKAYYQSKLAQVMYTYWLAEQYKDSGITANCIRVTNVKIDIERYPDVSKFMKFMYSFKSRFSISPEEMAKTYTYLATSEDCKDLTGKHIDENNKEVTSSNYSKDPENIDELMKLTEKYM
jgi:NAD(P)-dependent dehydrogenase (short-subunit alcohol dehydrogenase family)